LKKLAVAVMVIKLALTGCIVLVVGELDGRSQLIQLASITNKKLTLATRISLSIFLVASRTSFINNQSAN